jgi:hypothetical protein
MHRGWKVGLMALNRRTLGALIALVIVVAAFGAGYRVATVNAERAPVYTGQGYVGADQATFESGDTFYGFTSSVAWTDETGSFHDSGWPACLTKLQEVSSVRFAAQTIWVGQIGTAQVVWVDCQAH